MTREAMLIRLGGGGSPPFSLSDADLLSISLRASWGEPEKRTSAPFKLK